MTPSARTFPIAAVAALIAVFAFAGSAYAIVPTSNPLPGSNFQAGDGDQDETVSFQDWQSVAGSVTASASDPDDPDTNVGAGNIAEPDGWDFGTQNNGSNPPKGNVFAAWGQSDPVNSDYFLYMAFRREDSPLAGPEVAIGLELLQASTSWTNSKGDAIPCRTYNDLLISFDPHPAANSDDMDLRVYRWDPPTVPPLVDDSDPSCPDGKYGKFTQLTTTTSNTQAAINFDNGTITNYLGGDPAAATLPSPQFGEAGLNLQSIISANNGAACWNFQQAHMLSRSSNDVNNSSNLQDRIGPVPLALSNCGIDVEKSGPATVEHGQQMTFTYEVKNAGTQPLAVTSISDDKCSAITGPVKTGGNQDDVLEPGETWTYSCTMDVPAHTDAENPHVNTVTVNGHPDGDPGTPLSDQDTHAVTIDHPTTTTTTTTTPPEQQTVLGQQIPVLQPEQGVLGDRARAGRARIAGKSGCVSRRFRVRVGGVEIERVVFKIDGKHRVVKRRPNRKGKYVLTVRPKRFRVGAHRVKARVTFSEASGTRPKTLRVRFERCVRRAAPQFTG